MKDKTGSPTTRKLLLEQARRPVVALPAIFAVALIVGLFLDNWVGTMRGHWPWPLERPSRILTDIGKSAWILYACAAMIAAGAMLVRRAMYRRRQHIGSYLVSAGLYIFASVALSGIISNLLKRIIGRARPVEHADFGVLGFHPLAGNYAFESFPSGHSTTAGALSMALALLFPRMRTFFLVAGLLLMSTRIFVGAHYASDGTAGLLFGAWFAFMTAWWFADRDWLFVDGGQGLPQPRR